jgi:hypothetical protein
MYQFLTILLVLLIIWLLRLRQAGVEGASRYLNKVAV